MKSPFAICLTLSLLGACSVAPEGVSVHDPYEARNRSVHAFNKNLTGGLGSGESSGPRIPAPISERVIDFADNVALPGVILNNTLQGDLSAAGSNSLRFLINSVFGLFGVFDPSDIIGLEEIDADFGQTLSVWGAPEGAYLELPLIGPSTERDTAGMIVDVLIDPLGTFLNEDQLLVASVGSLAGRVAKIDQVGDTIGDVLNESADSYTQAQLIYLQNRRFEIGAEAAEVADPYADLYGDP
ncbi:MAG: VacJ family lipoprotein [Yoonia sp.]|uniref:MlaA family lipoprotein n=1 Tax=Yoonia sp. TaxID=2212373 RepID=UPI00326526E6